MAMISLPRIDYGSRISSTLSKTATQFYIYIGCRFDGTFTEEKKQFIGRQCEIVVPDFKEGCLVKFSDSQELLACLESSLKKV